MKIVVASDHNGVELKDHIAKHLTGLGHEVIDGGPATSKSVDYPDYAFSAAELVASGSADRGILICGSGVGMSIAANKGPGVRAALCVWPEAAGLARNHNDANVLTLAGWQLDSGDVFGIVDRFLDAPFDGGRHARRVGKIIEYEKRRGD